MMTRELSTKIEPINRFANALLPFSSFLRKTPRFLFLSIKFYIFFKFVFSLFVNFVVPSPLETPSPCQTPLSSVIFNLFYFIIINSEYEYKCLNDNVLQKFKYFYLFLWKFFTHSFCIFVFDFHSLAILV